MPLQAWQVSLSMCCASTVVLIQQSYTAIHSAHCKAGWKTTPPPLDGIDGFLGLLDEARKMRNDLAHSLPVKHGLQRRTTKDVYYVRNFYTVESLREARTLFEKARRKGIQVLYSDGGEAIKRWYSAPQP